MRKLLSITLLLSFAFSYGQFEDYDNVDEGESGISRNASAFDIKDRLYLNLSNSYFVDFVTSPLGTGYLQFADFVDSNGNTVFREDPIATKTSYQSIFSIGFEPRLNIVEIKENLAFAVSAPVAIGFGTSFAAADAAGVSGFGHIQVPLLLKLYSGASSTYDSDDDFGISAGAGFELNKIGLFRTATTEAEREMGKAWIMPSVSLGVHFYRGYSPMEVNIKYGFGPIETQQINEFGERIFPEKITRASSLKLSLVYMIGG